MNHLIKETIHFLSLLLISLLISFLLTKLTGGPFKWWITIGLLSGNYLGKYLFRKKQGAPR